MGTRHLIAVVIDGAFKIAQYGQWDGYPEGQGRSILAFLRQANLETFKTKVRGCHWLNKAETEAVNDTPNWSKVFPQLSRDAGAEILSLVASSEAGLGLINTSKFGGDSLFCEWGYVIDLDAGKLEVYRGFNHEPTAADSRFPSGATWLEHTAGYEPIRLIKRFELTGLPDDDAFGKAVNDEDDAIIDWAAQIGALVVATGK